MESTKTRPNKNRRKRYLFRCFKSDDVIDTSCQKAKTSDPLLTYITLAEKQGIVLPTIFSSALTAAKCGAGEGSASRRRKFGKDRSFRIRQALIAALNHTSLGKKIIKKRKINKKTCFISTITNKLGGEGDNNIIISNKEPKIPDKTNSYTSTSHSSPTFTPSMSSSSPSSSSSSSSSCSTNSQTKQASAPSSELYPTKQKQDVRDSRKGYFGSNIALCVLFLASLLVLIFWGKFCAILCTSIGFFVVPFGRRRRWNEERVFGESTGLDSVVKYKKKFTMDGLLRKRKF